MGEHDFCFESDRLEANGLISLNLLSIYFLLYDYVIHFLFFIREFYLHVIFNKET